MKSLLLLGHMGIGDLLLCNGLIRACAEKYSNINIICFEKNKKTSSQMTEDDNNIEYIGVNSDKEAIEYFNKNKTLYTNSIALGNFGKKFMEESNYFDESFYKQAGINYKERWGKFKIGYKPKDIEDGNCVFVHDASSNGNNLTINKKYIDQTLTIVKPEANMGFFDYIPYIKKAKEIHCIDSSFAILVEHCDTNAKLFLHRYCRPNVLYPKYNKKWEIIC